MTKHSLDDMRAVCQPPGMMSRRSGEHWVGRLYGRRFSIRITRRLVDTPVQADQVTIGMIVVGLVGAVMLMIDSIIGPILAAASIQAYLVLDCVDGEIARWRRKTSSRGAYLDRLGHYVVEAALFTFYGYHVGRDWSSGWATLGVSTALLVIISKAETDLVLAAGGRSGESHDSAVITPRNRFVRIARQAMFPLRAHRLLGAVEASLAMVVVGIVGLRYDNAEQILAVAFFGIAAVVVVGHAAAILTSGRFDAPTE